MANIDVTDILTDPDFIDDMSVITRTPSVDSHGEAGFTEKMFRSYGCVQPASGKVVEKLPEAMRVANVSSFWFKGQIIATAPGKYSSIIVYKGNRYQVQTVADWTNWGSGWTEGTCIAEVPA